MLLAPKHRRLNLPFRTLFYTSPDDEPGGHTHPESLERCVSALQQGDAEGCAYCEAYLQI